MKTDKVYLVGFMGAGKTSVGRALAKRLDWRFVDIDEQIERREHLAVAEIFQRHGEPYFRGVERDVLAEQVRSAMPSSPPAAGRLRTRRIAPSSRPTARRCG